MIIEADFTINLGGCYNFLNRPNDLNIFPDNIDPSNILRRNGFLLVKGQR